MDAAQGTDGALAKRHRDADAQYLDLRALCVRLSLSRRTVRTFINDPANPLPAYKCGGGKILCKWVEVERWIRRHRVADVEHALSLDDFAIQSLNDLGEGQRDV